MKKKVALVLGGGGALGYSHLGVLKVLDKHNVKVDIVVGTSMGGLIGASYCVGMSLDDMIDFAVKFRNIHLMDWNLNKIGLFSGKGVMRMISKHIPDVEIENLDKKYACVACDLINEKEVVIDSGSLRDAVRATVSMPGIFVPFKLGKKMLIDGGVINNLPEDVARKLGADIIISCDVLDRNRLSKGPKNAVDVLIHAMNVSTKEIQRLKSSNADVLLTPDTSSYKQLGFNKKTTLACIRAGEVEAKKHIDQILKILK